MVSLDLVRTSNASTATALPPGLVAVFVGGTSGIGEASLKEFVRLAIQPKIYIVGRSYDKGDRIMNECRSLNSGGWYTFISADLNLMRETQRVCDNIKAKEKTINILFLSQGDPKFDRELTSEGLNTLLSSIYYSRNLLTREFLPLLHRAAGANTLARVVTIGGGTGEGQLDTTDLAALRVPMQSLKPHLCTLLTLSLEGLAIRPDAQGVSFVHSFPGFVRTPYQDRMEGPMGDAARARPLSETIPLEESGARHIFLCTSSMFGGGAVQVEGIAQAKGVDGKSGGGILVYSVDENCDVAGDEVVGVLKSYRETGAVRMVTEFWETGVANAKGA